MLLQCERLQKNFARRKVIDDLSFRLGKERIHGIIGPNGAGKSTFFNLITAFTPLDGGSIVFDGQPIEGKRSHQLAALGLGRSFQVTSVFNEFTVLDNIFLSMMAHQKKTYPFSSLEKFRVGHRAEAEALLQRVQLEKDKDRVVRELSYGKKRLLELGLALYAKPKLLLLDEPFAGIGLEELDRVSDFIKELSKEAQIMIVEHNLSVVARLCDVVSVLHQGRVLVSGSYAEVAQNEDVQRAYLGKARHD